jgi:PAS domain S-box-containing protein
MSAREQAVSDMIVADDRVSLLLDILPRALCVTAATWLGSELSRVAVYPDIGSAIVFPPYAILTTVLLLTPVRRWWVYMVAAFVGHVLTTLIGAAGPPLWFAASTEMANQLRALAAVVALRAVLQDRFAFDNLERTGAFLVIAGLLAPAVGAFAGALIVLHGRGAETFWTVWQAWLLSNTIVGITLLPLLLIAAERLRRGRNALVMRRVVEGSLLAVSVVAVSVLGLTTTTANLLKLPALYAPLTFLLWAAVRFGPAATCVSLLVVVTSAIVGVTSHWGPFATQPADDGVHTLYMFLIFTSVPCLLLSALVKEREQVLEALNVDIVERKYAQRALEESEKRTALAATSVSLGFWSWDLRTNDIWLSEHGRQLLGLRSGAPCTGDSLMSLVHVDDRQRVNEATQSAVDRRMACEGEYRIVRDGGKTRWISFKGRLEFSADIATQMIGVIIDVTERKEAELELQDRRRELAHLGRVATVGQLSGALAHELRQPLTAILSNARAAQLLLERTAPDLDEVRTILADIVSDDVRAGEVIARLRGLLKKDVSTFESVRLAEILGESIDIAHHDLVGRGVVVTRETEWSLPAVFGDRVQLQQVLINLVMNACDAMRDNPPGNRRLTVGTSCDDAGFVVAYVTDCGTGILQGDVEQVFEPFVTSKREGLGLGLAICRTIVTAHRGRLWAVNNAAGGATFFLALPPYRAT